jgi:hypothetical protein
VTGITKDAKNTEQGFRLDFEVGSFSPLNLGIAISISNSLGPLVGPVMDYLLSASDSTGQLKSQEDAINFASEHGNLFEFLSYLTVEAHEIRHFHEFLASPYGQALLFDHAMLASCNIPLMTGLLSQEECILLPLPVWAALSDEKFKLLESSLAPVQLRRKPPVPPILLESASTYLASIGSLRRKLDRPENLTTELEAIANNFNLTFMQMLESSAVSCQIVRLYQLFKRQREARLFCEELQKRDTQQTYTQLWNLWFSLEKHLGTSCEGLIKPGISHAFRNAVSFFCICATRKDDASARTLGAAPNVKCHPGDIFAMLYASLLKEKQIPVDSQIIPWLDQQAERMGLLSLKETLDASVKLSQQRASFLREHFAGSQIDKNANLLTPMFLDGYDELIAGHAYMCETILRDPLRFFNPAKYLKSLDCWVAAPIYYISNLGIEEWERRAIPQRWNEKTQWRIMTAQELSVGKRIISWESAKNLAIEIRLAMAFWLSHKNDPTFAQLAEPLITSKKPGMKLVFL